MRLLNIHSKVFTRLLLAVIRTSVVNSVLSCCPRKKRKIISSNNMKDECKFSLYPKFIFIFANPGNAVTDFFRRSNIISELTRYLKSRLVVYELARIEPLFLHSIEVLSVETAMYTRC